LEAYLPNLTLSGNCLILGLQLGGDRTGATITDDKGSVWPANPTVAIENGQLVSAWVLLNVAPGIRHITITPTGGTTTSHPSYAISEYTNCALSSAVDETFSGNASAPNFSIGSGTTTADGDLIWMFAADVTSSDGNGMGPFSAGPTATLLTADRNSGVVVQEQIQTAHGLINPSFSVNGSDSFTAVAVAIKAAPAGTAPGPGIRIVKLMQQSIPPSGGNTFSAQFPTRGNLFAMTYLGELGTGNTDLTGITDSNGNAWTQAGPNIWDGTLGVGQIWYAANPAASATQTQTFTASNSYAGGAFHSTAFFYDIAGAATAPFDVFASTTGIQNVPGNLTTVSITPTTANGLVLAIAPINAHTISGLANSSIYHTDAGTASDSDGGDTTWAEANGWGHVYNSNTATLTFVWTTQNSSDGVQEWEAGAAAFKRAGP
jgi:hypothetical protein